LLTAGDGVAAASPEAGEACRQRLARLRARVAFQPTVETLAEAGTALVDELREFVEAAARSRADWRREMVTFRDTMEAIFRRQDFYAGRLRQFAAQMEQTAYPMDAQRLDEIVELQSSVLRNCVESWSSETASLAGRMRKEMQALDERLAGAQSLDPVTGLINRKEMLEQIASHQENGAEFSLLLFEVGPRAGDEIMRVAAGRMLEQFRHIDRVARWGERQFMVLFRGNAELAALRAQQILPWVEGPYKLAGRAVEDVHVALHPLRLEASA
jgi:GGDEF domain-containing protein